MITVHMHMLVEPGYQIAQVQTCNVGQNDTVLCHSRNIHPMWVKLFTETLSNKGSEVQGQSPKGALTVTDEK